MTKPVGFSAFMQTVQDILRDWAVPGSKLSAPVACLLSGSGPAASLAHLPLRMQRALTVRLR
ncbi:hypothetical protein [Deinococcus sp. QL22]|uniref:hypothetical protein n=1 Tax=Deinococcus sp. QL22 TaxID=2939437 RepID=UPI002017F751|nr:hypothetical protein [Deinococcus sp. QL22]